MSKPRVSSDENLLQDDDHHRQHQHQHQQHPPSSASSSSSSSSSSSMETKSRSHHSDHSMPATTITTMAVTDSTNNNTTDSSNNNNSSDSKNSISSDSDTDDMKLIKQLLSDMQTATSTSPPSIDQLKRLYGLLICESIDNDDIRERDRQVARRVLMAMENGLLSILNREDIATSRRYIVCPCCHPNADPNPRDDYFFFCRLIHMCMYYQSANPERYLPLIMESKVIDHLAIECAEQSYDTSGLTAMYWQHPLYDYGYHTVTVLSSLQPTMAVFVEPINQILQKKDNGYPPLPQLIIGDWMRNFFKPRYYSDQISVFRNIAINFLSQNKLIGNAGEDDEDYDPHIIRELIKIVFMNTIDGKSTVAQHRAHNEALYAIAEALRSGYGYPNLLSWRTQRKTKNTKKDEQKEYEGGYVLKKLMKQIVPIMDHIFAKRSITFQPQKTAIGQSLVNSLNTLIPLDNQHGEVITAVLRCIDHLLLINTNTITNTNTNSSSSPSASSASSSASALSSSSNSSSNNNSISSGSINSSDNSSIISSPRNTTNVDTDSYALLIKMIRQSGILSPLQSSVSFIWTVTDTTGLRHEIVTLISQYTLPFDGYTIPERLLRQYYPVEYKQILDQRDDNKNSNNSNRSTIIISSSSSINDTTIMTSSTRSDNNSSSSSSTVNSSSSSRRNISSSSSTTDSHYDINSNSEQKSNTANTTVSVQSHKKL